MFLSLSLAMDMDVIPKVERESNNNHENQIAFRHKFGVSPMMADSVWEMLLLELYLFEPLIRCI